MTLLVYAITDGTAESVDAQGLDAQPLIGLERGGVTMVVTDHDVPPVEVTEPNLRRYEEVLDRLMQNQTVLPARFGTTLSDREASFAVLRDRRGELRTALDGVRGAVELGVQGHWRTDQGVGRAKSTHPGTSYLKQRLSSQRRISQVEEHLRPLQRLSERSRAATIPRRELAFAAGYLVPRTGIDRFVALATELGDQLDDLELECTGPWPPYSFVDGEVA